MANNVHNVIDQASPTTVGRKGQGSPGRVCGTRAPKARCDRHFPNHFPTTTMTIALLLSLAGVYSSRLPHGSSVGLATSPPKGCLVPEPRIDLGMTAVARCGTLADNLECSLVCCCETPDIWLQFDRQSHGRVKRGLRVNTNNVRPAQAIFDSLEPFAHGIHKMGWTPHLLVIVLGYVFSGNAFVPVALIAGMLAQSALGCTELGRGSFISAGDTSWIDFDLSEGSCLRIVGSTSRLQISAISSNYSITETWRHLLLDCRGSTSISDFKCHGASRVLITGKPNDICKSEVIEHGWGTGCFIDQPSEAITCVTPKCAGEKTVYRPYAPSLEVLLRIKGSIRGNLIDQHVYVRPGHSIPLTGDGDLGSITCSSIEKFPRDAIIIDGRVLSSDWVTTAEIPQKEGERLIGAERAVIWGKTSRGV